MYKAKGKNWGHVEEEQPILTSVSIVIHKKLLVTDMTMSGVNMKESPEMLCV